MDHVSIKVPKPLGFGVDLTATLSGVEEVEGLAATRVVCRSLLLLSMHSAGGIGRIACGELR
jgi:hypothetical protein